MRHLLTTIFSALAAAAEPGRHKHKPHGPQSLYPFNNLAENKLTGVSVISSGLPDANIEDPCGRVLKAQDQNRTIPAQLAWDCLQAVPFIQADSLEFVKSVRPYVDWQTTLTFLKNPPPGYPMPATDVIADLDRIEDLINKNKYRNDYEFEFDLYLAFQKAHDGHFRIFPHIIEIFFFRRPFALVSVSNDGKELPKPYVYNDIVRSQVQKSFKASAITHVDGQDAVAYLTKWSQIGGAQDPDTNYNNNFFTLAGLSKGLGPGNGLFNGLGRGSYNYPGPNTTLTFANGTTKTYPNFAVVNKDFTGIRTAKDLYTKHIFLPEWIPTDPIPDPEEPTPPGFPKPIVKESTNFISGYYIDTPGYKDVAVLALPSFSGNGQGPGTFQQVGLDFLKQSKKDGKKKLIIDVSLNNGGDVFEAYNLFLELFPNITPYGGGRVHATEVIDLIGTTVSAVAEKLPYPPPDSAGNGQIGSFQGSPFNYKADLNDDYKPFKSWKDKFGPVEIHGDKFTPIIRWNLSDTYQLYYNVSGYGGRKNVVTEKFYDANDIVIVTDGFCASTCTLLTEFLRRQAKVKVIALGGRPKAGIIPAIGGVKGANDYLWESIYGLVNTTFDVADADTAAKLSKTVLANYSTLPFRRSNSTLNAANVRNAYTQQEKLIPQQFISEPADCRLYYTPQMTVRATAIWEAAADVTWGGKSCIAGKIGQPKDENTFVTNSALPLPEQGLSQDEADKLLSAVASQKHGGGEPGSHGSRRR